MDVKEAIEFVEVEIRCLKEEIEICNPIIKANEDTIIKYNQLIALLKRGERFEKLKEEIEYEFEIMTEEMKYTPNSNWGRGVANTIKRLGKIIEKYFPKEAKQDYPESEE